MIRKGLLTVTFAILIGFILLSVGDMDNVMADDNMTPTITPSLTPTPIPAPILTYITAVYTGGTCVVGDEIDRDKIIVTAYYSDYTNVQVNDYTISEKTVDSEGVNHFIVVYRNRTCDMYISGKRLIDIVVTTSRYLLSVGNMLDSNDIRVTGVYSNGSTALITEGYTYLPSALTSTGKQTVVVSYKSFSKTIEVLVREYQQVKTLTASYNKTIIVTGQEILKSDLTVMAILANNTTERITTFMMSKTSFDTEGENVITISYGGVSTTLKLNVIKRTATSMRAEYRGGEIVVKKELQDSELYVYVTFNDNVEERVTDYTIYSKKIRYVGDNTIRIYYDALQTSVTIRGLEAKEPDYGYVSEIEVSNESSVASIMFAIPRYLESDCIVAQSISAKKLRKIFKRLKTEGDYIGFEIGFSNDDFELELPMTARIILPEGYDIDNTNLYYTPNLKTIIAKMNKEEVDKRVMEVTFFKTGTYLLVASEEDTEEQQEEE